MTEESPMPRTAGELRRRLAEMGDPWSVDPRLADDDPLPDRPRGAVADDPHLEVVGRDVDFEDLLRQQPPANPELLAHWRAAGILPAEEGS